MFLHLFIYRIKSSVRNVQLMFWTLAFPILLASFFGLAFSNLNKADAFSEIPIGVVKTGTFGADSTLQSHLDAVSSESDDPLLTLTYYSTEEEAGTALSDKQIKGFLVDDADGLHLHLLSNGLDETITKQFLDWYLQVSASVERIIKTNPSGAPAISGILEKNVTYITDQKTGANAPNSTLTYYYALIGMTCLYGAFMGLDQVSCVQANQSPAGARLNLAPVSKLKVFACSLCAVTLIQYLTILLLVAYLSFVLHVDFGNRIGFILLASFAGCCAGVSFGAVLGAVIKKGDGIKSGILIGSTMTMSFFAGLMQASIKYAAIKAAPFLAYINPAEWISDAFYALYYFDTYDRFFQNVALLFAFSFVMYLIVYAIMRRQQYASL